MGTKFIIIGLVRFNLFYFWVTKATAALRPPFSFQVKKKFLEFYLYERSNKLHTESMYVTIPMFHRYAWVDAWVTERVRQTKVKNDTGTNRPGAKRGSF
jgi:hypothetical protein